MVARTNWILAGVCVFAAAVFAPRLARALDVPEEDGDVQIPEGFEERRYAVSNLVNRPANHALGEGTFEVTPVSTLSVDEVMQIVRNCVAPDSWTKRGSARMEAGHNSITVVQKKEVFPEIEKVLQWLQDGIAPPFRAAVVAVTLKAETIRKLTAAGNVPAADLMKAIEDAGEGNSETVELRGVEGQQVAAVSGQQQSFVKDFDVSGAVFDPVVSATHSGMTATAVAYRNPDCASVEIDMSVKLSSRIEDMQKAKLSFAGIADVMVRPEDKDAKKDDKKKPEPADKRNHPEAQGAEINGDLTIDLPTQGKAGLQTSLAAAQGAFVLAGTIDFSLTSEKPGTLTAVFVRATVGSGKVPTLVGVSGLKEGESYRLYPLAAGVRAIPDFPHTELGSGTGFPGMSLDWRAQQAAGGNAMNPFAAAPAPPTNMSLEVVNRTQRLFTEKVRKNKLVEMMGPVMFTRLLEPDHARALKNLMDEMEPVLVPMSVHAVALAVPQAAYRKLMLADGVAFDAAEVLALAGNGGQVLADTGLKLLQGQQSNVYAGVLRNVLYDYEISGDSYDPVIRSIPERAYAADFRCRRASAGGGSDVEVRFHAVPGKVGVERAVLDTFTVNSGAQVNVLMGLRADLDKVKTAAVSIRSNGSAPAGKYIMAGSARMPVGLDGKVDARQAVVFLQVDAK